MTRAPDEGVVFAPGMATSSHGPCQPHHVTRPGAWRPAAPRVSIHATAMGSRNAALSGMFDATASASADIEDLKVRLADERGQVQSKIKQLTDELAVEKQRREALEQVHGTGRR